MCGVTSRRHVQLAVLVAAFALGALAAGTANSSPSAPSLGRLVGQTIMSGMSGTTPSASLLARIRRGEIGAIILFAANVTTRAQTRALVARLQQAARSGGNPPLLIATDQGGGSVRRFPAGPPFESAATMGRRETAASVRAIGRATGDYLRALGVDVNLAPVVDVPNSPSSFLGSRAFSRNVATVVRLGPAFATGVQQAGVAATAKHFPGLGTATANTDLARVVIGTSAKELTRRLAPFEASIRSGVRLVMVSNASYPALDRSGLPASLSPAIVDGLLRGRLGFTHVVITDTLAAPGPAAFRDAPVRALKAGVDVLLFPDEASSAAAFARALESARAGTLSAAVLRRANSRIADLKAWLVGSR
jgi:beta-N-acetylhexosaminidase